MTRCSPRARGGGLSRSIPASDPGGWGEARDGARREGHTAPPGGSRSSVRRTDLPPGSLRRAAPAPGSAPWLEPVSFQLDEPASPTREAEGRQTHRKQLWGRCPDLCTQEGTRLPACPSVPGHACALALSSTRAVTTETRRGTETLTGTRGPGVTPSVAGPLRAQPRAPAPELVVGSARRPPPRAAGRRGPETPLCPGPRSHPPAPAGPRPVPSLLPGARSHGLPRLGRFAPWSWLGGAPAARRRDPPLPDARARWRPRVRRCPRSCANAPFCGFKEGARLGGPAPPFATVLAHVINLIKVKLVLYIVSRK